MELVFTYGGIVENNRDPLKLGRLKVRVPHVYGINGSTTGCISTSALPWAMPAGMPAGGSGNSGGFSHIPEVGDKVWVRFLDGEPEKPIWEWGMQSGDDADTLKLHSYADTPLGVGGPNRTVWTRYGHAIEMNAGSMILTTSQGYRLVLTDASAAGAYDGALKLSTSLGQYLELDDNTGDINMYGSNDWNVTLMGDVYGSCDRFSWDTTTGDFDIRSGGQLNLSSLDDMNLTSTSSFSLNVSANTDITTGEDLTLSAANVSFTSTGNTTVEANSFALSSPQIKFGSDSATEPYVLGNQLSTWITSLFLWLSTHTHSGVQGGSSTSGPAQQPTISIQPLPPLLLSRTITGQ